MIKKIILLLIVGAILAFSLTAVAMGVVCPRCHMDNCMWTGRTFTDAWGIHQEYQCINGHRFFID